MAQVSSYNVANRSGAQVREDINDIYSAIKTCNSGPNDPASPEQFMLFGDNTTGDNRLKIYDGSQFRVIGKVTEENLGLLPRAGGTMEGQLLGNETSLADAPAYAFENDTDTGIFRKGTNQIGFSCAGTEIGHIQSAGLFVKSTGSATRGLFLNDADNTAHVSLKAPNTLSGSVGLTLPPSITNGGFLQTDGSGNLSFQIVNGVPTGAIFALPDTQGTGTGFQSNGIPTGYLECNGQLLSRTTYAALYEVIGTRYGNTDQNNFRVPDLRGEFIRGWDNTKGVDAGREIGSSQGGSNAQHNHTASSSSSVGDSGHHHFSFKNARVQENRAHHNLLTTNFPAAENGPSSLNEAYNMRASNSASDVGKTSTSATGISVSTTTSVGNEGTEARPRNIAMIYIIKI